MKLDGSPFRSPLYWEDVNCLLIKRSWTILKSCSSIDTRIKRNCAYKQPINIYLTKPSYIYEVLQDNVILGSFSPALDD